MVKPEDWLVELANAACPIESVSIDDIITYQRSPMHDILFQPRSDSRGIRYESTGFWLLRHIGQIY